MYRSGILGLTILAPRGAPCALEGERCSGYIGTPWPRRGPRRTKWLVSLAQPRGGCRCSLGRLAHRCVSGPPRNLQRCLLFFLSLAPSLALFGLLYLILSSVRQPLPKRSGGAATTGQALSCRAMLAFLACPVLLPSTRTAVLRRLQLRSSGTRGCRVPCPIAMQLRMPEDSATIDALVEQTRQTSSIVVVYYADPSAFAEPEWSSSWGDAPEPSVRDDIVSRVANE